METIIKQAASVAEQVQEALTAPMPTTDAKTKKLRRRGEPKGDVPTRIKKAVKSTVILPKQPETVQEWAIARAKYPTLFRFTTDGDLVSAPVLPSDQERIIIAPKIISTSVAQQKEFFQKRLDSLKEPEETFAEAKRNLQKMMMIYTANPGAITEYDIILANQQVHDAECILGSLAKGPRYFLTQTGVVEGQLTHDWYDRSVIPDPVCIGQYTTFPIDAFYTEAPEEPITTVSAPLPTAAEIENITKEAEASLQRAATPSKPAVPDARRAAIIAARIRARSARQGA
jgi:hypothetical protein